MVIPGAASAAIIFFGLASGVPAPAANADRTACANALDRGDFAEAAHVAESLVRLRPASAEARVLLARAEIGLNKPQGALTELHEALRLDPHNLDALYFLSKLTAILSRQEFLTLAELAPDSPRVHQIQAEGLAAKGDTAGAEREFLAALEKKPGTVSILIALGDLKRHTFQYGEALPWYQKVLEKVPDDYDGLYGAGACYLLSKKPAEALPLFRRALKADPASLAAKMALGETLLVTGAGSEAVALLEEAAKADPDLQRLQNLLARAYQIAGRSADARRAFQRYRDLSRSEGDAEPLPPEGR
ncbi:MAG: Tetratricopeptide 1 repeat-containing protein [Bryobacterales bacterium]|nr:Tetratricopeptide 1 repeat-containing protein [Bryobacterales bacterium]